MAPHPKCVEHASPAASSRGRLRSHTPANCWTRPRIAIAIGPRRSERNESTEARLNWTVFADPLRRILDEV